MPFEISISREFSAAHALRLYDGSLEPVHGHNWRVQITVQSAQLDSIGVVMDFHELERLADAILAPFCNHHLNDVPPFSNGLNPSAENVALHIAEAITLPRGVFLTSVEVWETPANRAAYYPQQSPAAG